MCNLISVEFGPIPDEVCSPPAFKFASIARRLKIAISFSLATWYGDILKAWFIKNNPFCRQQGLAWTHPPLVSPSEFPLFFFLLLQVDCPTLLLKLSPDWCAPPPLRHSECDVQSSCFLQLCLKVNLVVARSLSWAVPAELIQLQPAKGESSTKDLSSLSPCFSTLSLLFVLCQIHTHARTHSHTYVLIHSVL